MICAKIYSILFYYILWENLFDQGEGGRGEYLRSELPELSGKMVALLKKLNHVGYH